MKYSRPGVRALCANKFSLVVLLSLMCCFTGQALARVEIIVRKPQPLNYDQLEVLAGMAELQAIAIFLSDPYGQPIADTFAAVQDGASRDTRCNPFATPSTKEVTAGSDYQTKFLAAKQLYMSIMAQIATIGGKRNMIGSLPQKFKDGAPAPVFTAIWSDGSSTSFFVTTSIAPPQMLEVSPPNSETPAGSQLAVCLG